MSSAARPLANARPRRPGSIAARHSCSASRVGLPERLYSYPSRVRRPRPARTSRSGRSASPPRRCAARAPGRRGWRASRSRGVCHVRSPAQRSASRRYSPPSGADMATHGCCDRLRVLRHRRRESCPHGLVADTPDGVAFLDTRPVFPGHTLVVPRTTSETLADLPAGATRRLFRARPARSPARSKAGWAPTARSSRSTTRSARACRTCTPTSSRDAARTGCGASSGPGLRTRRMRRRPRSRRGSGPRWTPERARSTDQGGEPVARGVRPAIRACRDRLLRQVPVRSGPTLLDTIAGRLAALVPPGTEVLAGLEMGGIAVVTRSVGTPICPARSYVSRPSRTAPRGRPKGRRFRGGRCSWSRTWSRPAAKSSSHRTVARSRRAGRRRRSASSIARKAARRRWPRPGSRCTLFTRGDLDAA